MKKCEKCGESSPVYVWGDDQKVRCIPCHTTQAVEENSDRAESIDPPLGWMSNHHEQEVMWDYSTIGTRLDKKARKKN